MKATVDVFEDLTLEQEINELKADIDSKCVEAKDRIEQRYILQLKELMEVSQLKN
ncbi:MAG: hypothetical protein JWM78_936 [Verrucomicrobiaceae bacterium]|nr:hypothetical protein [Verrucomicrobiaceae bacterium]